MSNEQWFDNLPRHVDTYGQTSFSADSLVEILYNGMTIDKVLGLSSDPAITTHDDWCDHFDKPLAVIADTECVDAEGYHDRRTQTWFIDDPDIRNLPVRESLLAFCTSEEQITRVNFEMDVFEYYGLENLLRMMFVLVNHFEKNSIVWGVGRGSSVASYCLFLIGIHRVDAILYDLDFNEFMKIG